MRRGEQEIQDIRVGSAGVNSYSGGGLNTVHMNSNSSSAVGFLPPEDSSSPFLSLCLSLGRKLQKPQFVVEKFNVFSIIPYKCYLVLKL